MIPLETYGLLGQWCEVVSTSDSVPRSLQKAVLNKFGSIMAVSRTENAAVDRHSDYFTVLVGLDDGRLYATGAEHLRIVPADHNIN